MSGRRPRDRLCPRRQLGRWAWRHRSATGRDGVCSWLGVPRDLEQLAEQLEDVLGGYAAVNSIDRTPDWFILKLQEQVGELTQSYLRATGQTWDKGFTCAGLEKGFKAEIADVLAQVLLIVRQHGIDPAAAPEDKWLRHHSARQVTADA